MKEYKKPELEYMDFFTEDMITSSTDPGIVSKADKEGAQSVTYNMWGSAWNVD